MDPAVRGIREHPIPGLDAAADNFLRERIQNMRLYRALERARAVIRIISFFHDELFERRRKRERNLPLLHPFCHAHKLQFHDPLNNAAAERRENNNLVQAIQKFRTEMARQRLTDLLFHIRLPAVARVFLKSRESNLTHFQSKLASDIGGHNDNRIFEIHHAALGVGQAAVVQNLQEDIEHLRMRFFNFVEQNHRIRPMADELGQLSAFLIPDIPGGRADEF